MKSVWILLIPAVLAGCASGRGGRCGRCVGVCLAPQAQHRGSDCDCGDLLLDA